MRHINVHKVILSSASTFFRNILLKNVHKNPFIYLKDIVYDDLNPILEFVYTGECRVANERLENFLVTAKDLGITGLHQDIIESKYSPLQSISSEIEKNLVNFPALKDIKHTKNLDNPKTKIEENIESYENHDQTESSEIFYVKPEKLNTERASKVCCKKCGKDYKKLGNLLAHIKENGCDDVKSIKGKQKPFMYCCSICNKKVIKKEF